MLISLFAHGLPSSLLHNDPVQHFTQESSFWSHFVLQSFVFTHFLVILVSFLYTRVSHDWNDVFKYMYIFIWNVLINYGESFFFDSNTLWYILQQRVFYITRCLSSDKTRNIYFISIIIPLRLICKSQSLCSHYSFFHSHIHSTFVQQLLYVKLQIF